MGRPMAANVRKHGVGLAAFRRSRVPDELTQADVTACTSPADVASKAV
jgi:2-hydroxy-3-oxopropionate reductase